MNKQQAAIPLSIDITTGDIITPNPVRRSFNGIFDPVLQFDLWTYTVETILAEKAETILRRGELNTRPRDFYDIYIITRTQHYDKSIFNQALQATAIHRGTVKQIKPVNKLIDAIGSGITLKTQWEKYRRQYTYAHDIAYSDTISAVKSLFDLVC
jgi:predicted nucleotidyltransferase component of viral defense system